MTVPATGPYHRETRQQDIKVSKRTDRRPTLGDLKGRDLFPVTAEVGKTGHLHVGGCDLVELVKQFGSPLYVFDEVTIREMCKAFTRTFSGRYPKSHAAYSSKAFANPALARILDEEGLSMDVVSGGELAMAKAAKFPAERLNFHGNNKSREELEEAVDYGIGRITIDSFREIELLNEVADARGIRQPVLLRVSPSIDAHTHRLTTTGILDTKFGFSIETGHAALAVERTMATPNLELRGIHFHLGSPLYEIEPYTDAIPYVMRFCAEMRDRHDLELRDFSPGGGFAIGYTTGRIPPPIDAYADAIVGAVRAVRGRAISHQHVRVLEGRDG